MRLVSVRLAGYRRFLDARMSTNARVVAIVGPNQAGKSSFLTALVSAGDNQPIAGSDLTRSAPPGPTASVISTRYRLDAAAKELLTSNGLDSPEFFTRNKKVDGSFTYSIEPKLKRDKGMRELAVAKLRAAAQSQWGRQLPPIIAEEPTEPDAPEVAPIRPVDLMDQLATALATDAETLPQETADLIAAVAVALKGGEPQTHRHQIGELLSELHAAETAQHPSSIAISLLRSRIPECLEFTPAARTLEPEYDLSTIDVGEPPVALANLADVAGLDLAALQAALNSADPADAVNLLDPANNTLKAVFDGFWRRANFTVRLVRQDTRLHILTERMPGTWTSIAESSDGMRAFVALITFAQQHAGDPKPILVLDEAETHLHYEAQADLIRVFESQQSAGQVIYTTHSAGCLPQDLGRGVRVIAQNPGTDTSEIRSSFWTLGPGFSPLVIAMGASALAFTPTRFAVMAEGASETLLLPTILREATGLEFLQFQVAPGLANASVDAIKALGLEAAKVAYIVDSDEGGRAHRDRLRAAEVRPGEIVFLGRSSHTDMAIEDFLRPEVYAAAVNLESRARHGPGHAITASQLPTHRRSYWLRKHHEGLGLAPLSSSEVAGHVLDSDEGNGISDPRHHAVLQGVHLRLLAALGLSATP